MAARTTQAGTIKNATRKTETYAGVIKEPKRREGKEVERLKNLLCDKEEIIEDLVLERDQVCNENYELRLKLADAWNIRLTTDAEKVREVSKRIRNDAKNQEPFLPAKHIEDLTYNENELHVEPKPNKTNQKQDRKNALAVNALPPALSCDSGIDIASLEDHFKTFKNDIERTINTLIDEKLEEKRTNSHHHNKSAKLVQVSSQHHCDLRRDRESNIIVHGLKEGETTDENMIKYIFEATKTDYNPMDLFRLGVKNAGKARPIMLRMKSVIDKQELMAKLWMLKDAKTTFKHLSITDDYTVEERKTIKAYVEESRKRNNTRPMGFKWKVRGTPRQGLKLVKIYED